MTKTNDYAIADYIDFEIHIKQVSVSNRKFMTALSHIKAKYERKENMVEKGLLSEDAGIKISKEKMLEVAQAYADFIIVDWKGKLRGKKLPEFTKENVAKVLSDEENDALFDDIIQFALEKANFEKELEGEEEKNSQKS